MEEKMENEKQRPVHEIALPFGGAILKAAIWRHQNGEKRPRFSVSFSRGYVEKDTGKWSFSGFFDRDETIGLSKLSQLAHDYLIANSSKGEPTND
jgi:hypothetical protein